MRGTGAGRPGALLVLQAHEAAPVRSETYQGKGTESAAKHSECEVMPFVEDPASGNNNLCDLVAAAA